MRFVGSSAVSQESAKIRCSRCVPNITVLPQKLDHQQLDLLNVCFSCCNRSLQVGRAFRKVMFVAVSSRVQRNGKNGGASLLCRISWYSPKKPTSAGLIGGSYVFPGSIGRCQAESV